jgi:RND family efflux transporter MFP subunit
MLVAMLFRRRSALPLTARYRPDALLLAGVLAITASAVPPSAGETGVGETSVGDSRVGETSAGRTGAANSSDEQRAYRVETEPVAITRIVHAEVRPVERPEARARIGGLLRDLTVDEGDRVEDGEVIALIEPPKLASRIEAATAERDRAEARQRRARRALARAEELHAENVMSQADFDDAREAAVRATNAVEAAESEIETLRARRQRGEVLAPAAGWVIEVLPTSGSPLQAGGLVARIAAAPAVIRIAVPERHLDRLQQAAGLTLNTSTGSEPAELLRLYPDVRKGRVEADLRLPADASPLPVGRRLAVTLTLDEVERVLIPTRLITAHHGLSFVNRAEHGRTLVQLGARDGDRITVLSGLRAGDRLLAP